jgi:uncharacterized membrane protein
VFSQARARKHSSLARVISALALWGALGLVPAAAAPATPAAAPPQFGIGTVGDFPKGYYIVTLQPGASTSLATAVVNVGDVPADLEVYPANAVNPANGGFAAADAATPPTGSTAWLSVTAEPFTLAGGSQRSIPFTITVPDGTPPGQYITALVASTADALPVPGNSTFRQVIRSTVPVEINVPGPINPGFTLGSPQFHWYGASATLEIPIENTGNILVKPAGTLTVTTHDGKKALAVPVTMQSVYAGSTTRIEVNLPPKFQPGDYTISLTLKDTATGASASIKKAAATLKPAS